MIPRPNRMQLNSDQILRIDKKSPIFKIKQEKSTSLPNNTLSGNKRTDESFKQQLNQLSNTKAFDKSDNMEGEGQNLIDEHHNTSLPISIYKRDDQNMEDDMKKIQKIVKDLENISSAICNQRISQEYRKEAKQGNLMSNMTFANSESNKRPGDLFLNIESSANCKESGDTSVINVECEQLIETRDDLNETGTIYKWDDNSPLNSPSTHSGFSTANSSKSRSLKRTAKFPRRAVLKNGECNVLHSTLSNSRMRYLHDIFTTLVDTQWRWTLLVFALGFMLSWLFYGGIWWLIAYTHGDFEHIGDEDWTPCVENLEGFASCFLFSVETQHTIGYGGRSTNDECPEAIFVMCMQSITGVMISAFMAGIFFAKMARPRQRSQTLLFSRRAVICQRDGQLCLMFRVGDIRKSHIIGASVSVHMFRTRLTKEGEELPQFQCELNVMIEGCASSMFFIWPLTVIHQIDKDSPLYNTSAQELIHENFEIVAILEGTVESTGQTTQARSSYLPHEIKWGHRFEALISYNEDRQGYQVDYNKFNNTVKVATPLCSAKDLDDIFAVQNELVDYPPSPDITLQ